MKRMPDKLLNPHQALGDYLDEMLHQATAETPPARLLDTRPGLELSDLLPPLATADEDDTAAAEVMPAPAEPVAAADTPAEAAAAGPERAATAGLDFPLQCLMFRVGAHLLSVPLVQLGSVVAWSDALTRLPQSPGWLLGLVKIRETNLRVVDSGSLLQISAAEQRKPEHLLVLGDSGWAITCDHLEQVVNLDHDDIQWKPADGCGMRLGTIRESLATLISPPGIARSLDERGAVAAGDR